MSNSASIIKRILVPLDLSEYAEAATRRACALAKANQATVTGMVVLDTPEITGSSLPVQACNLLDYSKERISERTREAEQAIHDALAKFATQCNEAGVPHDEAEFQGVPGDQIVEASHYFDLLVMGLRTYFHFETQTGSGDSLEKVLDHSPTPVLTLPKQTSQPVGNILIAFDGSLPAVRALHTFAQTTWPGKVNITILMSHKDAEYRDMALAEASAYLRSHGYDSIQTVATSEDIGKTIDNDFIEKTDLVVAGMHSKNRIKDFFVGSLTKQLIDYGHTALLLA